MKSEKNVSSYFGLPSRIRVEPLSQAVDIHLTLREKKTSSYHPHHLFWRIAAFISYPVEVTVYTGIWVCVCTWREDGLHWKRSSYLVSITYGRSQVLRHRRNLEGRPWADGRWNFSSILGIKEGSCFGTGSPYNGRPVVRLSQSLWISESKPGSMVCYIPFVLPKPLVKPGLNIPVSCQLSHGEFRQRVLCPHLD